MGDIGVVAAAGEHSSTTPSPGSGLCHGHIYIRHGALQPMAGQHISIHYLQKLEGLIAHGGDSFPFLDFTQTQKPGRINRINSLLSVRQKQTAASSQQSTNY